MSRISLRYIMRTIRRWLESTPASQWPRYSVQRHKHMLTRAYYGVLAFYTVNIYAAYQSMYTLMDTYGSPRSYHYEVEPFWPVFFTTTGNLPLVANYVALFCMGAALLVVLWPHSRLLRIAAFVGIIQSAALKYSFGVLNEKEQWWMWTAFLLIFLPSGRLSSLMGSLRKRQHYLDVFSMTQGMTLLIYTLIGYWKFYYAFYAGNTLKSYTLVSIVNSQVLIAHWQSVMIGFISAHPLLSQISYVFLSYVEFFSILALFRPSLARAWGVMLILIHVGTWTFMGIVFYFQPPLLAILLLNSPFIRENESWRTTLRQWPLVPTVLAIKNRLVAMRNQRHAAQL